MQLDDALSNGLFHGRFDGTEQKRATKADLQKPPADDT
jgi:hypothetical protein